MAKKITKKVIVKKQENSSVYFADMVQLSGQYKVRLTTVETIYVGDKKEALKLVNEHRGKNSV